MSRVKDTMRAINELRNMPAANVEGIEQIKSALLGHIALSLAVIADTLQAEQIKKESEETT